MRWVASLIDKWVFGVVWVLCLAFAGCDEELPPVIMVAAEKPLLDTTYTAGVPPASPKKVLLFDITGVRCNNCPKAAVLARNLLIANPNRLILVALYPSTPKTLTLPWPGFDTMSTPEAEQIATALSGGGISFLPLGAVDQVTVVGSKLLNTSDWSATVGSQLTKSSPFNLSVQSIWKSADAKSRIEIKVVSNAVASGNYKWVVAFTESAVVSKQSDQDAPTGMREDYIHEHALRAVMGSSLGSDLGSNMPAGTVREKQFYYKPASKFKPENMDVVVWIYDNDTKEVIQVESVKLKLP